MSTEWISYIDPNFPTKKQCNRTVVTEHPLRNVIVTERIPRRILGSQPSTGRTTPVISTQSSLDPLALALKSLDPLTEFSIQEEMDPLSKMAAEMDVADSCQTLDPPASTGIESWSSRKAAILSKFTTSEKITIITSFLAEGEKVIVKAQSTVVDKTQHRLEQVDSFEEGSQRRLHLSQSEYVGQIEELNRELINAWHSEQRVKSLKIAIQCAKLLADTDVLPFYPSKFVLITDILDIFGQLVYERLRMKADYYQPGAKTSTALPEDFTPEMVPESAKETCMNWFYKIASIRELVPRIYVEMALLKSYNFISSSERSDALERLTQMVQGIGNPLVAVYARCYLCRVGLKIAKQTTTNKYLMENFIAFLNSYQHLFNHGVKRELAHQKTSLSTYMTLYTPALDFILEAAAEKAPESLLDELLNSCAKYGNSSLILNTIMSAFKPASISERTLQFLDMMTNCTDDGIPLFVMLRTLGLCISVHPPANEQRRQILGIVWKHIASLENPGEYVTCAEAWIKYVVEYFTVREINTVVGDIIDHLAPDRTFENHYNELKLIIDKIISNCKDLELLLVMDNFLPFIDMFQQESMRVEVCKKILSLNCNEQKTNDPIITNALMFLSSILHDSVNALTPEDEYKQIGEILCGIVRKVDYGRDFDQQMIFYMEARGAFSNIDVVLAQLVQCINTLSVSTRQIIKGLHTRKTADFVRACAAYCFITIPSIISVKTRLELYLLSGQVALFNQCLAQADACFKAALSVIPELQEPNGKNETYIVNYVKQFLSTLLVVPDNPGRGVLSLTRILLNVVRSFQWNKQNGSLAMIYINVIDVLAVMSQEVYPYHVEKVESNDAMYGSDVKFVQEVNNICTIILGEILALLKDLGTCRKQTHLATELFLRVIARGDLSTQALQTLTVNLWQLIMRSSYADLKYMTKIRDSLKKKGFNSNNVPLQNLVERFHIKT